MASTASTAPDASASLMLAIVITSATPVLLLDKDLRIVVASTSFCSAFQLDPASIRGQLLSDIGRGEWGAGQLMAGLAATVSGSATITGYELMLESDGRVPRALVLEAHRLDYGLGEDIRIMLSAADVTEARKAEKLKDDLLRDKAMLLQELQHRVANSLQIIASVLMQSARSSGSDETRLHLNDAHDRVMSVASLQRQLALSSAGEVNMRSYFTDLCRSIGASMIQDRNRTGIEVTCDDSVSTADVSVSLGLIVTELVINCLKHAFPNGQRGRIRVSYRSSGPDWTLSVGDNGVGMPMGGKAATPGLGTSIVEALARQQGAVISVSSGQPGTIVTLEHLDIVDIAPPPLALVSAQG